jgi:hypothetical protein
MYIDMLSFSLSTATDVFPIATISTDAKRDFSLRMMVSTSPASITSPALLLLQTRLHARNEPLLEKHSRNISMNLPTPGQAEITSRETHSDFANPKSMEIE